MFLSIMDLGPWITVCLVAFFVCNYMESRGDVCVPQTVRVSSIRNPDFFVGG